jgi:hypothetical protein
MQQAPIEGLPAVGVGNGIEFGDADGQQAQLHTEELNKEELPVVIQPPVTT